MCSGGSDFTERVGEGGGWGGRQIYFCLDRAVGIKFVIGVRRILYLLSFKKCSRKPPNGFFHAQIATTCYKTKQSNYSLADGDKRDWSRLIKRRVSTGIWYLTKWRIIQAYRRFGVMSVRTSMLLI